MSKLGLHAYLVSETVSEQKYPFYSLIAAAIRKADTENMEKLTDAWPDVVAEFKRRYWAPGGVLPEDAEATR